MASPVDNNSSQYPLTIQRQPSNHSRVEPLAQELAEYVIPILRHHTVGLIYQRDAISSLGVDTASSFHNVQDHVSYLEGRIDVISETLSLVNRRVGGLNARLTEQTEELRILRDLPCNRLQRAVTTMCTYL